MLAEILPLIPEHYTYIEPFFGGGAVFFAKTPSKAEVVNDTNERLITFYQALKHNFEGLHDKIEETFHSRSTHTRSDFVYKSGNLEDELNMAWAFWTQTNMSFSSTIGGGFGYDRRGKIAYRLHNKKQAFRQTFQERMKFTTIECNDVLKVIKAYDSPDAFFYLDPPYVSANQGHYKGYTEADFIALLDACSKIQGKFLLSSYPESVLMDYRKAHGWRTKDIQKTLAVDGRRKENRTKTECLTWNY